MVIKEQETAMFRRFRPKTVVMVAALGLATLLGGCVVYPAGPGYYGGGGYGYGWHHHHDRW